MVRSRSHLSVEIVKFIDRHTLVYAAWTQLRPVFNGCNCSVSAALALLFGVKTPSYFAEKRGHRREAVRQIAIANRCELTRCKKTRDGQSRKGLVDGQCIMIRSGKHAVPSTVATENETSLLLHFPSIQPIQ